MSDDAMIESQRRLAALGLFRRVRITELPRTGSLTRDVLVDLEEADTTTIDYGGGLEVGGIGGRADDGSGAIDKIDIGPRGFFSISRRNLWGKNRSVTLFGRVTVRRRERGRDDPDPTDDGGYGFNDYRSAVHVPRAARVRHHRRRAVHGLPRAEPPHQLHVQPQGRDRPTTRAASAPFTLTGRYTFDYTKVFDEQIEAEDQLLIDRLFPQVKLSKFFGACCATRETTCSIRSAAR